MQKYILTAIKSNVNNPPPEGDTAAQGATVTVKIKESGALATIYSDNGTTVKQPPFQTDSNGNFEFYAANGRYIVEVGDRVYDDILLYDKNDDIATQSEAIDGTDNEKTMTPLRTTQYVNSFGIGSSNRRDFDKTNIESKPTGIYTGFGGQHPSATTGDNPFQDYGGAFSCFSSTGLSGGLADYRADIACQLTSLTNYRLRFRSSTTVFHEWADIHTDVTLLYAVNSSGSQIASGEIVSGSSITPVRLGSYRNCSGNDLANGAGGIFIKVW